MIIDPLLRIRLYDKSGKVISERPLRQTVYTKEKYEHIIATKKPIEYTKQKEDFESRAVGVLDISPLEEESTEDLPFRVVRLNENNEEIAVLFEGGVEISFSRISSNHLYKEIDCYGYKKNQNPFNKY